MSAFKDGRRSPRILASVPLEIQASGESLDAITAVISLHGALILSTVNWPQGTMLNIKNKLTDLKVRGRVVWSGSAEIIGHYKLGVEFEAASPEFWADLFDLEGKQAV